MTDGIGRIFGGGNSYGVGGYQSRKNTEAQKEAEPQVAPQSHEERQVDPSKVMEFLANNNYFIAPVETSHVGEVDSAVKERIGGYMEDFEMIYGIIVEEFGEEIAPAVMDLVMDTLMGMAA